MLRIDTQMDQDEIDSALVRTAQHLIAAANALDTIENEVGYFSPEASAMKAALERMQTRIHRLRVTVERGNLR